MALSGALFLLAPQTAGALPRDVQQKVSSADAPSKQLKRDATRQSFGTRFYTFTQRVGGYPVIGGDLVVTDAPGEAGDFVSDSTAKLKAPPKPSVSETAAIVAATDRISGAPVRRPATARLAVQKTEQGGRLVWQVGLYPGLTTVEALVDARSGQVLGLRDLAERATARARIFVPNPIKTQRSFTGLRETQNADNGDADSARLTRLRRAVTLRRLNNSGCLQGKWVHAFIPQSPPEDGVESEPFPGLYDPAGNGQGRQEVCAGGDFTSVTRGHPAFEALMAYFHIDRTQRYLQSLGFRRSRGNGLVDRRIEVYVNYIGEDNSYYSPGSDSNPFLPGSRHIVMGIGGVDDGEDADVFVHEYTHAIQDAGAHSWTISPGRQQLALGEGDADYIASSISRRYSPTGPKVGNGCWAAWDVQANGDPTDRCLRRVDLKGTRPAIARRCEGSGHCEGQAWSGALWAIRANAGARVTDRTLLQSHFSYSSSSGFKAVARAWLKANRRLYKGRHVKRARRIFCKRRILTSKKDCRVKR